MESWEKITKQWDDNWKALKAEDQAAKIEGKIIGRFIDHPYADGKAIYKIVKESARTATIEVCTGLGDDWVLPAWGRRTSLSKKIVLDFLYRRDRWDDYISKK